MISEKDKKVIQQSADETLKALNKRVQRQMLQEMRLEEEHDFWTKITKDFPRSQK